METMVTLNNQRVLVTGGTGFVGSHLVQKLIKEKCTVVVPYRSIDYRSYFVLEKLDKKVILAAYDLKDGARIFDLVSKYEIDYIFHLGAQPLVTTAFINPIETVNTNVMGTLHILEAARNIKTVKGVIVASSDKAYGKSSESYNENSPLRGDHPYEVSKSAADLLALAYVQTYQLPVVVVRCGNIFGPGDLNYSRIIPGIMKAAVTGETLILRSDGTFIRDYISVSDVVSAYLWLLKKFDTVYGSSYNVAAHDSLSVINLVKKSRRILKKKIPLRIENNVINEIPCQHLNWSKIKGLGWKPHTSLVQGLRVSFAWYKKHQKVLFNDN